MAEDIRKTERRTGPQTGSGSGAAYRSGYGAGGLGAGGDRAQQGEAAESARSWDAPGVTPGGARTGSSTDGPRTAMDGEGEPYPDPPEDGLNESARVGGRRAKISAGPAPGLVSPT